LKPLPNHCNFAVDAPKSHPYKRVSHGERGVRITSRVLATKGFATQIVPSPKRGSRPQGRALYASSDWKGIRRRRRTFAPTFSEGAAQMFLPSLVRMLRCKSEL
jgi:hypothetical protein